MGSEFNILVIEDDAEKARSVCDGVRSVVSDIDIRSEIVTNLVDALRRLEVNYYDLVVLDILIPAANRNPNSENSRVIIEQLASGRLVMPACVIGLTAFEDEYRAESQYYSDNLFSIEQYDRNSDRWLKNIVSRIRFLNRWKSAYGRASSFSFDIDVAFLTARSETEFNPIINRMEWVAGPSDDLLLYKSKKLKRGTIRIGRHILRTVVCCQEEMGMAAAAAVTAQLVAQFRPKVVMMLGMCCGFRQEECQNRSNLGDVIVARETACWDDGKYGEVDNKSFFFNRAKPRVVESSVDHLIGSLLESDMNSLRESMKDTWNRPKAKSLRRKFKDDTGVFPDVKYGLLLSGSSVIAHDVKGDEIIMRFGNALGLEMEVFGVYTAVDRSVGVRPLVLGIKGVADFGDGAKHKEFQSLSSELSYCVGSVILARYFDGLLDGAVPQAIVS